MSETAGRARTDERKLVEAALSHFDRNDPVRAEAPLLEILALDPDQPQALQLLGQVRRQQERFAEAENLYRRSLTVKPDQPQVQFNLGNLLSLLGRHAEAAIAYGEAVRLKPNFAEAHLNRALALSMVGDHTAAEKSCRDALRVQPNYLLAKQALATELCEQGRPAEAEQLLRRTLATGTQNPRQAAALEHAMAMALKQQDRFEEALNWFDAAQSHAPDMPAVDFNRANTLQQLGRTEEAAASYARAVARDPAHADAHGGSALMCALTGAFAQTRVAGSKALALDPAHPIAHIALAIADVEEGAIDRADEELTRVCDNLNTNRDPLASFALGFAADAFERHGHYKRAFDLFSLSNQVRRDIHAAFRPARASLDVDRLRAFFETTSPWPPSASLPLPDNAAKAHVFVLGFMRSGTTLLETILATNPRVVDIDEIEFLTGPAREFLLSREGLDRLADLGPTDAQVWRNAYWKAVGDAGIKVRDRIFVDKMPFNSIRLPLIARLFPEAKVVFAIRDPRDVVISCYRRRFNPTGFSYEFLDLEDCARFYAATMELVDIYRAKLPLAIHDHRYEDMIIDFDGSIQSVCAFTGIEWSESMREFTAAAQSIDRRSASARQVRRGLYAEGVGQWRNFANQLQKVAPILEPWVARFGYESR